MEGGGGKLELEVGDEMRWVTRVIRQHNPSPATPPIPSSVNKKLNIRSIPSILRYAGSALLAMAEARLGSGEVRTPEQKQPPSDDLCRPRTRD